MGFGGGRGVGVVGGLDVSEVVCNSICLSGKYSCTDDIRSGRLRLDRG